MNICCFKKYKLNILRRKELKKNIIKYFLSNQYNKFQSNKIIKFIYRNKFYYKYMSLSFFRRNCLLSGNGKSIFRFFKLSRYLCKHYASNGIITGLRKSSF